MPRVGVNRKWKQWEAVLSCFFFVTKLNMCRILAKAPGIAVAVSILINSKCPFRYKKCTEKNFLRAKAHIRQKSKVTGSGQLQTVWPAFFAISSFLFFSLVSRSAQRSFAALVFQISSATGAQFFAAATHFEQSWSASSGCTRSVDFAPDFFTI